MRDGRGLIAPAACLLAAAAAVATLAVAQPYALASLTVVVLGPLHVLLAARYLLGRAEPVLSGTIGRALLVAVGAMTLVRIVSVVAPQMGRYLETIGGWALIAAAAWVGLRTPYRYLALAAAAALALLSLANLPWYWTALTHGHNVVPLIFLWDWSRRFPTGARVSFLGAALVWASALPALLASGLLDPLINPTVPTVVSNLTDPAFLLASASTPGLDAEVQLRFLAAFGFMQAMHYVLWLVFFQVAGRPEVARLARRFPIATGWRFWATAAAASALVWAAYTVSYLDGRSVYGVLGALNVFLEQPVAVWLVLTALPAVETTGLVARLRAT